MLLNLKNETVLNLLFRLDNKSIDLKEPDAPIINAKGLTIIDWDRSDSDAVNRYLNRLIRLQLAKYFKLKSEARSKEEENRSIRLSEIATSGEWRAININI